jgi:PAS domain S-box-containing protein
MRTGKAHRAVAGDPKRRHDEEALRESEAAFHELLELAPDAVVVSDRHHRITHVNAAACRLYGYSCGELLAMTIEDLIGPEEMARAERELPPVPGRVHRGEWSVKRKDGAFVPVEASIKNLPDGRRMAFVRDITPRKRAERERDESLRWMRAVFEQAPVGMSLVHGPHADRVEFNARAQQMLGTLEETETFEQIRKRLRWPDGKTPDELPAAAALRGERTVGAELFVRNAAGTFTPITVNASPIVGPDGTLLGAVVAFEDTTAARELERLRAEWGSLVAHDLRHPLAVISLNAEMLGRHTPDPRVQKDAERILSAARRLDRMVGDLMDISRLEARRLELARERVDVAALVEAAVDHAKPQAPDRRFEVCVHGPIPEACADPDRIAQVLENLLSNAVKYGTAGSPITVTVEREGVEIAVSVTNEGRGLTAQEVGRIFDRFQRTASAKLEGIQGVGLGLYITRSLVEAHGGRITAESSPKGVTTFRFTLPVAGR